MNPEGSIMTATYTFDIFCSLDGFGSHHGDWGGYWGKQGPELLGRRLAVYGPEQRMVFGANTYRDCPSWRDRDRERSLSCSDGGSCLVGSSGDRCHRAGAGVHHVGGPAVGG